MFFFGAYYLRAMNGFPVDIPTKRYIKAYVEACCGLPVYLDRENIFGNKLIDLISNPRKIDEHRVSDHDAVLKVYVPMRVIEKNGKVLTRTGIRCFNVFAQQLIKKELHHYLDLMTSGGVKLNVAVEKYQKHFMMTEDDLSVETIQKSYYRYREEKGLPYLRQFNSRERKPIDGRKIGENVLSFLTAPKLAYERL